METQSRIKSPYFSIGLISAEYTELVGQSAVLVYCIGNNPSLTGKY